MLWWIPARKTDEEPAETAFRRIMIGLTVAAALAASAPPLAGALAYSAWACRVPELADAAGLTE